MDFTGKNIVITGASSGIGLASARLLAQKGGNVYEPGRVRGLIADGDGL